MKLNLVLVRRVLGFVSLISGCGGYVVGLVSMVGSNRLNNSTNIAYVQPQDGVFSALVILIITLSFYGWVFVSLANHVGMIADQRRIPLNVIAMFIFFAITFIGIFAPVEHVSMSIGTRLAIALLSIGWPAVDFVDILLVYRLPIEKKENEEKKA